ncbi:MAG: hypothetical protein DBY36_00115 [Clostridiales bacterium]|nr:MAG: hypothetical protein DBY36_00115 [Clostridiales bacterium]
MFLNIMDFGAKADGQFDDTPALINAMEAAKKENGTVYFPSGEYRFHPVKIPSNITLLGYPAWGYVKQEEGQKRLIIKPLSSDGKALFDMDGCVGTRIIGLHFDGLDMGENFHCIYSKHRGTEQNIVFEDLRITNFSGCGIVLDWCWVFVIRRCLIILNKSHAIDATKSYDGWVIDNQLSYNGGYGYFAGDPRGGTATVAITANRIEGGPGGMYLCNSNSLNITGNSFDSCNGPALTLKSCRACSITGSVIRLSGRTREGDDSSHVQIEDSAGISFVGNSIWGWYNLEKKINSKYAFVLRGLTNSLVAQNAVFEGYTDAMIKDYGGHVNTIIDQNVG